MLGGDVVRSTVASPSSTPECHGGIEAGGHPDRAQGRGCVDEHTEGRLAQPELQNDRFVLRVDCHRMAHPPVPQNLDAPFAAGVPIVDDIERQHRAEFLDRQRIVASDAFQRCDENPGIGGRREPGRGRHF